MTGSPTAISACHHDRQPEVAQLVPLLELWNRPSSLDELGDRPRGVDEPGAALLCGVEQLGRRHRAPGGRQSDSIAGRLNCSEDGWLSHHFSCPIIVDTHRLASSARSRFLSQPPAAKVAKCSGQTSRSESERLADRRENATESDTAKVPASCSAVLSRGRVGRGQNSPAVYRQLPRRYRHCPGTASALMAHPARRLARYLDVWSISKVMPVSAIAVTQPCPAPNPRSTCSGSQPAGAICSSHSPSVSDTLCPPELKVRTPARAKQLGWYADFESRGDAVTPSAANRPSPSRRNQAWPRRCSAPPAAPPGRWSSWLGWPNQLRARSVRTPAGGLG